MTWTTPKTWQVDELLTAADLNTHLRDNLNALKAPPTAHVACAESSDYTTTSTTFVDVDSSKLTLTITTNGGDVMVGFHGAVRSSDSWGNVYLDVAVDGTREGGANGLVLAQSNTINPVGFVHLVSGLAAGEHTFTLQWRVSGNTGTLFAVDLAAQFWVREVS